MNKMQSMEGDKTHLKLAHVLKDFFGVLTHHCSVKHVDRVLEALSDLVDLVLISLGGRRTYFRPLPQDWCGGAHRSLRQLILLVTVRAFRYIDHCLDLVLPDLLLNVHDISLIIL